LNRTERRVYKTISEGKCWIRELTLWSVRDGIRDFGRKDKQLRYMEKAQKWERERSIRCLKRRALMVHRRGSLAALS